MKQQLRELIVAKVKENNERNLPNDLPTLAKDLNVDIALLTKCIDNNSMINTITNNNIRYVVGVAEPVPGTCTLGCPDCKN